MTLIILKSAAAALALLGSAAIGLLMTDYISAKISGERGVYFSAAKLWRRRHRRILSRIGGIAAFASAASACAGVIYGI